LAKTKCDNAYGNKFMFIEMSKNVSIVNAE